MPRELTIAGVRIADDAPCYVIGEIGHNHGGDVDRACAIIEAVADAGVSAVKFQKRDNAAIYTRELLQRPYDHEHSYGRTYGAHRNALEFDADAYRTCYQMASVCGVAAFSTAFDEASADFLMEVGTPAIKIASGDLTNTPFLDYVAGLGVPLILSTGGDTPSCKFSAAIRHHAVLAPESHFECREVMRVSKRFGKCRTSCRNADNVHYVK